MINSVYWSHFVIFLCCTDTATNFLCILLSYQYFDGFYLKMCGLCDQCFTRLLSRCWGDPYVLKLPDLKSVAKSVFSMEPADTPRDKPTVDTSAALSTVTSISSVTATVSSTTFSVNQPIEASV